MLDDLHILHWLQNITCTAYGKVFIGKVYVINQNVPTRIPFYLQQAKLNTMGKCVHRNDDFFTKCERFYQEKYVNK